MKGAGYMSSKGSMRPAMDIGIKNDPHYEEKNKSLFPAEVANDLKAALEARELTPEQAAEEIGIPLNTVIQICNGGSPKGARKIKAKVKGWLEAHEKKEEI